MEGPESIAKEQEKTAPEENQSGEETSKQVNDRETGALAVDDRDAPAPDASLTNTEGADLVGGEEGVTDSFLDVSSGTGNEIPVACNATDERDDEMLAKGTSAEIGSSTKDSVARDVNSCDEAVNSRNGENAIVGDDAAVETGTETLNSAVVEARCDQLCLESESKADDADTTPDILANEKTGDFSGEVEESLAEPVPILRSNRTGGITDEDNSIPVPTVVCDSVDAEELAAKAAVLGSSSSDIEGCPAAAAASALPSSESSSQKKKLKTKKQLDGLRRKARTLSACKNSSASEDDERDIGGEVNKGKIMAKRSRPSSASSSDEKARRKIRRISREEENDVVAEVLCRPVRVDTARLPPNVRRKLMDYGSVCKCCVNTRGAPDIWPDNSAFFNNLVSCRIQY
jgi:hypothetical protein